MSGLHVQQKIRSQGPRVVNSALSEFLPAYIFPCTSLSSSTLVQTDLAQRSAPLLWQRGMCHLSYWSERRFRIKLDLQISSVFCSFVKLAPHTQDSHVRRLFNDVLLRYYFIDVATARCT